MLPHIIFTAIVLFVVMNASFVGSPLNLLLSNAFSLRCTSDVLIDSN